jgi:hypothetical protein
MSKTLLGDTVRRIAETANEHFVETGSHDVVKVEAISCGPSQRVAALRISEDAPTGTPKFDDMIAEFEDDIRYHMSMYAYAEVYIVGVNMNTRDAFISDRIKVSDFDLPVNG